VLADNEPFIIHAYKSGLEEAGYIVAVAEDGDEAVRQILALHPDVVLLELILPKQDGFSVLKTVKADPAVSAIPVIVLTSLSQDADTAEARNCGAAEVMLKSDVSLQDVLLVIERLLSSN
jgi:DNA-binding response OmpR family regulator